MPTAKTVKANVKFGIRKHPYATAVIFMAGVVAGLILGGLA